MKLFIIILLCNVLFSCEMIESKKENNYAKKENSEISSSKGVDSIMLGLYLGMKPDSYFTQINKLIDENKIIRKETEDSFEDFYEMKLSNGEKAVFEISPSFSGDSLSGFELHDYSKLHNTNTNYKHYYTELKSMFTSKYNKPDSVADNQVKWLRGELEIAILFSEHNLVVRYYDAPKYYKLLKKVEELRKLHPNCKINN